MQHKQKQVIEAYRRAQGFLDAHSIGDGGSYGVAKQTLDEVVARLQALGTTQLEADRLSRNETMRRRALTKELWAEHLRPIARIARATLKGADGIRVAVALPRRRFSTTHLLADAVAVRNNVAPHKAAFVAHSLRGDFLERLDAAIAALAGSATTGAESYTVKVGASQGIAQEIRRGRDAVEILDTLVQMRFARNAELLARWRSAVRVRRMPGGAVPTEGGDVAGGTGGARAA